MTTSTGIDCSVCAHNNRQSTLVICQLNLEEAIYLCPHPKCTYPLDETDLVSVILKRKPSGCSIRDRKLKRRHYDTQSSHSSVDGLDVKVSKSSHEQTVGVKNCHKAIVRSNGHDVSSERNSRKSVSVKNSLKVVENGHEVTREVNGLKTVALSGNGAVMLGSSSSESVSNGQAFKPYFCKTMTSAATSANLPPHFVPTSHQQSSVLRHLSSSSPVTMADSASVSVQHSIASSAPTVSPLPIAYCAKSSILKDARTKHLTFNISSVETQGTCGMENGVANIRLNVAKMKAATTTTATTTTTTTTHISLTDQLFIHWSNEDALCWLDVAMAMVVHCRTLRSVMLSSCPLVLSVIGRLLRDYDEAQVNFRRSCKLKRCHYLCDQGKRVTLETSVGQIMVKTGGGGCGDNINAVSSLASFGVLVGAASVATIDMDDISGIVCDDEPGTTSVDKVSKEAFRLEESAKQLLTNVRDMLFETLCPLLSCKRGQTDSALLALSALLSADKEISKAVSVSYRFQLDCTNCHTLEQDRVCKEVPTFLKLPNSFSMSSPSFLRPCFRCMAPDQTVQCTLDRLPDVFFCHFMYGINVSNITDYDFTAQGRQFFVTGFIQYRASPRHFVCHLRQINGNLWLSYDDLKSPPVCQFKTHLPSVNPSEVHIVMWESRVMMMPLVAKPPLLANSSLTSTPAVPVFTIASSSSTSVTPVSPLKNGLSASSPPVAWLSDSSSTQKPPVPLFANCVSAVKLPAPVLTNTVKPSVPMLTNGSSVVRMSVPSQLLSAVRPPMPLSANNTSCKMSQLAANNANPLQPTTQSNMSNGTVNMPRNLATSPTPPLTISMQAVGQAVATASATSDMNVRFSTPDERLMRARERFKQQQNGLGMSTFVRPVIPINSVNVVTKYDGVIKQEKEFALSVKREKVTRRRKTDACISIVAASSSNKPKLSPVIRPLTLGGSTYSNILDRLHRRASVTSRYESTMLSAVSNGFGSYVPKSKLISTSTSSPSLSSSSSPDVDGISQTANGNTSPVHAMTVTTTSGRDRQHKVCFMLPTNGKVPASGKRPANGVPSTGVLTPCESAISNSAEVYDLPKIQSTIADAPPGHAESCELTSDDSLVFPEDISWLCDELFSTNSSTPIQTCITSTAFDSTTTSNGHIPELTTGLSFDDDFDVFDNLFTL